MNEIKSNETKKINSYNECNEMYNGEEKESSSSSYRSLV